MSRKYSMYDMLTTHILRCLDKHITNQLSNYMHSL